MTALPDPPPTEVARYKTRVRVQPSLDRDLWLHALNEAHGWDWRAKPQPDPPRALKEATAEAMRARLIEVDVVLYQDGSIKLAIP